MSHRTSVGPTRRDLFLALAAAGVGTEVFQRALAAEADKAESLTPEALANAEWIAGLELSEADRKTVAATLTRWGRGFRKLHAVMLENDVPPALAFDPAPFLPTGTRAGTVALTVKGGPKKPEGEEELAFLPVTALAGLIRTKKITSTDLTKLYLKRLKEYDPVLSCVVTLTEATALEQAARADKEIAAGRYRGPLHGIPWGAKDLIAYPGYPTTWGAEAYKDQKLEVKATVAKRLEDAGAVLVAKLSLGALANGDRWFGDRQTKSPWSKGSGSSGSSAGSASATAAGLVGFSLGSETLGSIVSPCRVCGTTGLRPTFGRVSRHGCMTLCWSMDKIGPITRSIEDCALVFGAIQGRDGLDASAVDRPFTWPHARDPKTLKVGFLKGSLRDQDSKVLRDKVGVELVPIELPSKYLLEELTVILYAEAAAAFDELTRKGKPIPATWKSSFRAGQLIPAVDYLRANRIRTLLMREMAATMAKIDLYVGGQDLLLANLTGHPTIVLPNGFAKRGGNEVPHSITFTGQLFGEAELLAVGHAFQQATDFHSRRPAMEKAKKE
jgi:Asp-tRNA(Asn)/Glu-tRNA(Gln) amidotransferase A subunit family amidase